MKLGNRYIDKVKGSLIGGAVGDALGFPVEFMNYQRILCKYGPPGIARYDLHNGVAEISDDTQMTLFTACGMMNAARTGSEPLSAICRAYLEWLYTQSGIGKESLECYISKVPELHARRAPGLTCMSALTEIADGGKPENDSKGCGGIMRIAPIPLFGISHGLGIEDCDRLAADTSMLTHLHPLGYLPSALLSHLIYRLADSESPTRNQTVDFIGEGIATIRKIFPSDGRHIADLQEIISKAVRLSSSGTVDIEAIRTLGAGWVAEETLAIAVYCSLKHFDSFEDAVVASVNHSGDSDSTGAVTGNIMGAALGYTAIPEYYKTDLELRGLIEYIADNLASASLVKPR